MDSWSNIQVLPQDKEIIHIDQFEKSLGKVPDQIYHIRNLITRFEVCHFKYERHIQIIKDSIDDLNPKVDPNKIGIYHIQHGAQVVLTDTTGKSITGLQYIRGLKEWLGDRHGLETAREYDKKIGQRIRSWLGDKNTDKIRLVRLLLARLRWDWNAIEELNQGGTFEEIEQQLIRMDICHYAFPKNLDLVIKSIGQMRAVEEKVFEGCGSYNSKIKSILLEEFLSLCERISISKIGSGFDRNASMKKWLFACLAKTIKENIDISIPIPQLEY